MKSPRSFGTMPQLVLLAVVGYAVLKFWQLSGVEEVLGYGAVLVAAVPPILLGTRQSNMLKSLARGGVVAFVMVIITVYAHLAWVTVGWLYVGALVIGSLVAHLWAKWVRSKGQAVARP